MPYVLPDGRRVSPDAAFSCYVAALDDIVQHPPGWLRTATQAEKDARGITWENDPVEFVPPPTPAELERIAAAKRWAVETGGIVVMGATIRTDEFSQTKILGARVAAKEDAGYTLNWKESDGTFYALNAAQIIAIGDAVRNHVQACFDAEMAVVAAIRANPPTITSVAHIEAYAWPSNS